MGSPSDDFKAVIAEVSAEVTDTLLGSEIEQTYFAPRTPKVVLDAHANLLVTNQEYKDIFDQMEKDRPVFEELLTRMDESTRRVNQILENNLGIGEEE